MTAFTTSLLTAIGAGFVTYFIQLKKFEQQMIVEKLKVDAAIATQIETIKTEYVAERTAKAYLEHPDFKKRSFSLLKARLSGFTDDELRKILVRAGAVKFKGENKSGKMIEWWGLLNRNPDIAIKNAEDDSI